MSKHGMTTRQENCAYSCHIAKTYKKQRTTTAEIFTKIKCHQ